MNNVPQIGLLALITANLFNRPVDTELDVKQAFLSKLTAMAKASPVRSCRFFAMVPDKDTGGSYLKPTYFSTGVGPCGRFVTNLECILMKGGVVIKQTSYDPENPHIPSEKKSFAYRQDDIKGRIETIDN